MLLLLLLLLLRFSFALEAVRCDLCRALEEGTRELSRPPPTICL